MASLTQLTGLPALPSDSDSDYKPTSSESEEDAEDLPEDEEDEEDATLTQLTIMAHNSALEGNLEQAEQMYRGVLAGRTAGSGPDHPTTLLATNDLALFLQKIAACVVDPAATADKLAEAEQLLRQALQGYETSRGTDHSDTLCCCNNLAQLLYVQEKDLHEVEPLFRRALSGNEAKLGVDHPSTLASVSNLARVLEDVNKLEEAGVLYERCFAAKEDQTLTPDILEECNDLAKFWRRQEKYEQALPRCLQAVEGRTLVCGALHSDTLASLYGLAAIYIGMEEYAQAKQAAEKSLTGYATLKMVDDVQDGVEQVSLILLKMGRENEIAELKERYSSL